METELCPHTVFMCFALWLQQTAIISAYTIHRLLFQMEARIILWEEQTEPLYICNVG